MLFEWAGVQQSWLVRGVSLKFAATLLEWVGFVSRRDFWSAVVQTAYAAASRLFFFFSTYSNLSEKISWFVKQA